MKKTLVVLIAITLFACPGLGAQAPLHPAPVSPQRAAAACSADDLPALVRQVVENDIANDEKERDYVYVQRGESRELDGKGKVKKTHARTAEVFVLYGEQVQRTLEIDDKPLSAAEQAKQEERINKLIRERNAESEEQKRKRQERYDQQRAEERAWVNEIATAYNFTLAGEDTVEGRPAYIITGEPRNDFHAQRKQARILPKLHFRAWVDEQDCQWVKADVEAIDTISFGAIVARIHEGSRILLEQTRVNGEVWLPRRVTLKVGARVMLFKNLRVETDVAFRDYRKFRIDTKVIPAGGLEAR